VDREQVLFRLIGRYCPEGTILYTEGSAGEEAYLVQSGAVRGGGPGGERHGPGTLVGAEAFLERAPRPTRVEAVADTRLLLVGERTIDALARNGPEVAAQVVADLVAAGEAARRTLEAWSLAHALERVEPQLREAAAGPVPLAEVRERGGAAALRLLEDLARRGAVAVEAGSVRVADAAALERAGAAIAAAAGEPG